MKSALNILGFTHVLHALDNGPAEWDAWGRAGWANYPYLSAHSYAPRWLRYKVPHATRKADWDRLFGAEYQSICDLGAVFGPS